VRDRRRLPLVGWGDAIDGGLPGGPGLAPLLTYHEDPAASAQRHRVRAHWAMPDGGPRDRRQAPGARLWLAWFLVERLTTHTAQRRLGD